MDRCCRDLGEDECNCFEATQKRNYKKIELLNKILTHLDEHGWAYSEQCGDYYTELNQLAREARKIR